jgi:hypothetical protein
MALIAYIDAGRIRMYKRQSRISRVQPLLQLRALRAIQLSALLPWHISFLLNLPGSAQLASTTQTL